MLLENHFIGENKVKRENSLHYLLAWRRPTPPSSLLAWQQPTPLAPSLLFRPQAQPAHAEGRLSSSPLSGCQGPLPESLALRADASVSSRTSGRAQCGLSPSKFHRHVSITQDFGMHAKPRPGAWVVVIWFALSQQRNNGAMCTT